MSSNLDGVAAGTGDRDGPGQSALNASTSDINIHQGYLSQHCEDWAQIPLIPTSSSNDDLLGLNSLPSPLFIPEPLPDVWQGHQAVQLPQNLALNTSADLQWSSDFARNLQDGFSNGLESDWANLFDDTFSGYLPAGPNATFSEAELMLSDPTIFQSQDTIAKINGPQLTSSTVSRTLSPADGLWDTSISSAHMNGQNSSSLVPLQESAQESSNSRKRRRSPDITQVWGNFYTLGNVH
jgi:hypothetical protein